LLTPDGAFDFDILVGRLVGDRVGKAFGVDF